MEVRFGDCVYRFAFPALPMVLFNHFRTVSVLPRTYRVHTRSCTKNHAFFMHFRQNRKKVLLPRSLQGPQTLL